MRRPIFDTNVFLNYQRLLTSRETARAAMSIVVLYELTATTNDKSQRQYYESLRSNYSRSKLRFRSNNAPSFDPDRKPKLHRAIFQSAVLLFAPVVVAPAFYQSSSLPDPM